MARYTGPATRISRRLKVDLIGGDQAFERRPYPPGQHGRGRIKESEYLLQLAGEAEGSLHLRRSRASVPQVLPGGRAPQGKTGEDLLQLLESRLDNVVYRAGLARTRRQARQLVSHGHFIVNGNKVNVPSFQVSQVGHHRREAEVDGRCCRSWWPRSPSATARCRVAAGRPSNLRVLVHQLPGARADRRSGQEQLIVELLLEVSDRPGGWAAVQQVRRRRCHPRRQMAGAAGKELGRTVLISQRPTLDRGRRSTRPAPGSSSSRWSPASATRWATRCAVRCCRPSRARR